MKRSKFLLPAAATCLLAVLLLGLFRLTYLYDNKYTDGAPYGSDGVFSFAPEDLGRPLFLIDGWTVAVAGGEEQETFIGEYSNFSYLSRDLSPFGSATYRLTLRCPGERSLTLALPEIFSDYILYLDGNPIAQTGDTGADFILRDEAELRLEVRNDTHYHSGLYFPPALGTPSAIAAMETARAALYAVVCTCALTLALYSSVLWFSRKQNRLFLHFGILCLCFTVSCLHPFVVGAGWSGALWYAIEDTARLGMLAQAVAVGVHLARWEGRRLYRRVIYPCLLAFCLATFFLVFIIIPKFGNFINFYHSLTELFSIGGWLLLCICAVGAVRQGQTGASFLAGGCCALGVGYLTNLLNANRFEPICGLWQMEYAGFCMVLLFGGLILCYHRALLLENRKLMLHMEELVQQRTAELGTVLEERKNFFSHMAHNLKAPIAAVHGFIALIRESNLYLDEELATYIRLIEDENAEMSQRVQSLSKLNAFDRITAPRITLEVDELLALVEQQNAPEVEVAGIHFTVGRLDSSAKLMAQREKLLILFENLIYNAISFTPAGGTIQITPRLEGEQVVIDISDTGSGISPEHLPHVFERFYTAREPKNEGSGLGLYIAKLTAEELGGTISVKSQPGEGTTFTLRLPCDSRRQPAEQQSDTPTPSHR